MQLPDPAHNSQPSPVDFLILGAGWTSTFLIPILRDRNISHAATSTTGRDGTIKFRFEPEKDAAVLTATDKQDALVQYRRLPVAATILITFPLNGTGQARTLTRLYAQAHNLPTPSPNSAQTTTSTPPTASHAPPHYILLGSSSIYTEPTWNSSSSPYDGTIPRVIAEDELLALATASPSALRATVLNLAGLYGGAREPRKWLGRVATTREAVRGKGGLHLVNGVDVARGICAVAAAGARERGGVERKVCGRRWLLTDGWVYDWWSLFWAWGDDGESERREGPGGDGVLPYRRWVAELMLEEGVKALPRDTARLGRCLDSRDFWQAVGILPSIGRVD